LSIFDDVVSLGLPGIERLENSQRHLAMPLYDRLSKIVADPEARSRAALGALRCAVHLDYVNDVLNFVIMWPEMRADPTGMLADSVVELVKTLARKKRMDVALALAKAEVERETSPRSLYLFARLLERTDERAAFDVYGRAAELAEREPTSPGIALTARVRRIERLAMDPATCQQAALEAAAAARMGASATPGQKLVIAAGLLLSQSHYARASGLSELEQLGRTARPDIAQAAIRAAAQHADRLAEGLSSIEADRVGAALKHWPEPSQRDSALVRLLALVRIAAARGEDRDRRLIEAWDAAPENYPLLCKAQAVLAGGGVGSYASLDEQRTAREGSSPGAGPLDFTIRLASIGLEAVVATRRGKPLEAASALQSARELMGAASTEAPPALWTAVVLALGSKDLPARGAALQLAEALLSASGVAPPPPSLRVRRFATLLRKAGRADLAVRTLRWAASAKDPSATQDLAGELARQGWSAALEGDREVALTALREARSLYKQATSGKPAVAATGAAKR
jgi:hypothetical protein